MASIALAAAVWRQPSLFVLALAIVFGAGATVLDLREVAHQHEEERSGLVAVARIVAMLHAGVAALSVIAVRRHRAHA